MIKNKVVRYVESGVFCLIFCLQGCHFSSQNDQKRLQEAEELYRQGISSNSSSQYESSTIYLKQAEDILTSLPYSVRRDQLLGLTWFGLGNTSESEMLYDIALNYYRKAISMLNSDSDAIYLTCAYRDIARTMALADAPQDSVLWYFAQAKHHAKAINNELLELTAKDMPLVLQFLLL